MRLVGWALAGAAIATSACLLTFLPIHRSPVAGCECGFGAMLWAARLWLLAFLTPATVGLVILWRAEQRLKQGMENDSWSDIELGPVRGLLLSPFWKLGAGAVIVIGMLSLAVQGHHIGFFPLLLLPDQVVMRLSQLVMRPKPRSEAWWTMASNFKPIQSEHWGEPKQGDGPSIFTA